MDNIIKSAYQLGKMEAVCKCAAIMVDENRRDIAREIFKTMKIDRQRLAELKSTFSAQNAGK
jgi:hypothetical protein